MSFKAAEEWLLYDEAGQRKYVTGPELGAFLAIADTYDLRRRALCYVLAYTGCRISEAVGLTRHQFDDERETLTFRTLKRRRTCFRTLPVPVWVVDMLRQIPVAEDGRFWPVHRSTAWRWIKRTMRLAAIRGPMATAKGLRHGFGMRGASKNVPLPLIGKWMGHASQTTTAIYLDAVGVEEREFARRMW